MDFLLKGVYGTFILYLKFEHWKLRPPWCLILDSFQNAQDKVPASVEQRVLNRKAFDREKPQLEAIIKQSDVELLTIECNVALEAMRSNAVSKLDSVFRYKAVDYFSYEEEEQEEEEEEEEEEVRNYRQL